ncbi:carboxypeptidase D [Alternaria panax]|uniref:Carboxypeptidase D n=1 Tax=Alternaria panax TaxID=48097 RepID=A0AAD4FDB0_9PLEO|nr:carboxypeptidase D [Alternaria panax]
MKSMTKFFAAPLLAAGTLAQFVPAPTDLITKEGYANISVRFKEVPTGICELDPNVKSYSGYTDIAEDQHVFWWFFEARNQDPSEAPLTVWINRGPGSSSMIGLFQELGPCGIGPDLKPFNNPYSWTNASNMLFIDQPTDVGFSYSIPIPGYRDGSTIIQLPNATCPDYAQTYGTCGTYSKPDHTLTANSTEGAAPGMWKTLQGFMGAFPQYSRNGFSFTTESYGGHYAPVFNSYFLDQNAKNITGAHKIELENVLIGNGWFDPLVQYQAYYNYSVYPGNTYDYDPYNDTVKAEWYNNMYGPGNCYDRTKQCYETGIDSVGRDEYDMRFLTPDPFPYEYFGDYLNLPEVQKAIGAFQNFSQSASTVSAAFGSTGDDDRPSGTIAACQKLLDAGVQVMLYYGDADYNCNWLGGQVVADMINATGYSEAGFTNITTSDGIVHGQVKQAGLFSFLRIYESGHEVPFYQPLASLEIFERALKQVDIATGAEKYDANYVSVGTPTSDYREGNATMQFEVTPANATYNTALNGPDAEPTWAADAEVAKRALRRRNVGVLGRPIKSRGGKRPA